MLILFYLMLGFSGLLLALAGTMSLYRAIRDRQWAARCEDNQPDLIGDEWRADPNNSLAEDLKDLTEAIRAANAEAGRTFTLEEAIRPPRSRLRYADVAKKWKEFLDSFMATVPQCQDPSGYVGRDKHLEAIAYNNARDVLEVWLKGSSVVHPTGLQCCDFLNMHPKKEEPPQQLPAVTTPAQNIQEVKVGEVSANVAEFTAQTYNTLMDRAVTGVTERVLSKIDASVEKLVGGRMIMAREALLVDVDKKIKEAVRDLLKETLQTVAEQAIKEAGEKPKPGTCANCEDLSDQDMFEMPENCGCEPREGVIRLMEKRRRAVEDEAFYQKVVEEESKRMDELRDFENMQCEISFKPKAKPKAKRKSQRYASFPVESVTKKKPKTKRK